MKRLIVSAMMCFFILGYTLSDNLSRLIQDARNYQASNPDSCILLSQKAMTLLSDGQLNERANIYWNLAQGYLYKHHYQTALFYALKGKDLFQENDTALIHQHLLGTIGWTYFDIGNHVHAEIFHQKALEIAKQRKDLARVVYFTNALGLDLLNAEQHKKALEYFRKALFLLDQYPDIQPSFRATLQNNIGMVYMQQESWYKAEEYLLAAVKSPYGSAAALVETYSLLAGVYLHTHRLAECEKYILLADELSYQTSYSFSLIEYYQVRYEYEKVRGNFQNAILYQEKYIDTYQKINNKEVQDVMNFMLESQNEKMAQDKLLIEQANELAANRKNMVIIGIIFSMVIIIVLYYVFKAKAERAFLRHQLLRVELDEKERQQAELNNQLANKEETIETLSLTMSKHNELFQALAINIQQNGSDQLKEAWRKVEQVWAQDISTTLLSDEFIRDFKYRLKGHFPKLTEKDIQMIIDIRNNLTSKEMADKYHVEVKSMEMSRYRLRKKLGLAKGEPLREFIMDI